MQTPALWRSIAVTVLLGTASVASATKEPAYSPVELPMNTNARFDKLSDQAVVEMRPQALFKDGGRLSAYVGLQLSAFFISNGDTVTAPDSISIMLIHGAQVRHGVSSEAADWWFSDAAPHTLRVLTDDSRLDLGAMRYERAQPAGTFIDENQLSDTPGYGTMPELLVITLPTDRVLALFDATSTEAQVDGFRFFIHSKVGGNDQRYRAFARYIRSLRSLAH